MAKIEVKDLKSQNVEVTDVRVFPYKPKHGKKSNSLLAFASITLNDIFVITGIKVMTGKKGTFISFPASEGSDGDYYDICYPLSAEARQDITDAVIEVYDNM